MIKYLNIGWNLIDANDIDIIELILENNKSLESLHLQHNNLKQQGAKKMVECLRNNTTLHILDISANEIYSEGFLYFGELFKLNTPL